MIKVGVSVFEGTARFVRKPGVRVERGRDEDRTQREERLQ